MNWRASLICGLSAFSFLVGCGESERRPEAKVSLEDQNAVMAFALSDQLESNEFSGAVTVVVGPEGILGMEAFGLADLKSARPMRKDSVFWIASMTKPMTAACVMMLVEEGKVSLDDPVSKHLPAFKGQKLLKDGKQVDPARPVTVKDLLTHTSGLTAAYATPAGQPSDTLPLEKMCDFYAGQPLRYEPGSQWSYNNPGINTLGRIVEAVSGMPYSDFLESRLLEPLGMTSTTFWPDESELERRALPYAKDKDSGQLVLGKTHTFREPYSDPSRTAIPAGGLWSTGEDIAKFCRMMLNKGELEGRRVLKAETVALMKRNQLGDMPKVSFTPGMAMGLGFHVVREPQGVSESLSAGSFGHGGAHGTQMWIDPVRQRAYVLLVQRANFPNSDASEARRIFQKAALESYGGR
ncbi:MAG: hypothetical protein RL105_1766 [Verrucomicrobiota bacterium]|jgi:CubicO group peptidase (beta-lactamase class C family)